MAKVYNTQTISGYNSSPPPDDGTEVSANEVKWATHKTKLGDPIKTLAQAINTELVDSWQDVIVTVDTMAELKGLAVGVIPSSEILLLGFTSVSDGGGGQFMWDGSSTTDDDGGTIIQRTAGGIGRWLRRFTGGMAPEWFGTTGDGTADDSAKLILLAAACVARGKSLEALDASKTYFIDGTQIDFSGISDIDFRSTIKHKVTLTAPAIIYGGFGDSALDRSFRFDRVDDGVVVDFANVVPPTVASIRCAGLFNGITRIGWTLHFELWADDGASATEANSHNVFYFGMCQRIDIDGANSNSWCNENRFHGGRTRVVSIGRVGGFNHNHNKFYDIAAESTSASPLDIHIFTGSVNYFRGLRIEGDGAIAEFDAGTISNEVEQTWQGVGNLVDDFSNPNITVTDNGLGNLVYRRRQALYDKVPIFDLTAHTRLFSSGSEYTSDQRGLAVDGDNSNSFAAVVTPGLDYLAIPTTSKNIFESDLIPVSLGDTFGFEFHTDAAILRHRIQVYDSAGDAITTEGGGDPLIDGSGLTFNAAGYYMPLANVASTDGTAGPRIVSVSRTNVAFIRLVLQILGTGKLRQASCWYMVPPSGNVRVRQWAMKKESPLVLTVAPTRGFGELGQAVAKVAGGFWNVTFVHETTLDGAVATSGTSVTVTTISTVANGDICGILLDDGTTHWSAISALASSTFTVGALPSAAADNQRIVFNRWA